MASGHSSADKRTRLQSPLSVSPGSRVKVTDERGARVGLGILLEYSKDIVYCLPCYNGVTASTVSWDLGASNPVIDL